MKNYYRICDYLNDHEHDEIKSKFYTRLNELYQLRNEIWELLQDWQFWDTQLNVNIEHRESEGEEFSERDVNRINSGLLIIRLIEHNFSSTLMDFDKYLDDFFKLGLDVERCIEEGITNEKIVSYKAMFEKNIYKDWVVANAFVQFRSYLDILNKATNGLYNEEIERLVQLAIELGKKFNTFYFKDKAFDEPTNAYGLVECLDNQLKVIYSPKPKVLKRGASIPFISN